MYSTFNETPAIFFGHLNWKLICGYRTTPPVTTFRSMHISDQSPTRDATPAQLHETLWRLFNFWVGV